MGIVTPKVAHNILMAEEPKVQLDLHLNKVYFLFDFNNTSIYKINILMVEYSDADKLPHHYVDTYEVAIFPYQTNYANNSQDVPLHDIFKDINCSWYTIKVTYEYIYPSIENESKLFYSRTKILEINNSLPVMYRGFISKYIKGDLRQNLRKYKNVQLWYGVEPVNPKESDVLSSPDNLGLLNISSVHPSGQLITEPTSLVYKDFLLAITTSDNFKNIITTYFGVESEDLPTYDEIPFVFTINQQKHALVITGNIKELYEKGL